MTLLWRLRKRNHRLDAHREETAAAAWNWFVSLDDRLSRVAPWTVAAGLSRRGDGQRRQGECNL